MKGPGLLGAPLVPPLGIPGEAWMEARTPSADAASLVSKDLPVFSWRSVWVYQDQMKWREGLWLGRAGRQQGGCVTGV